MHTHCEYYESGNGNGNGKRQPAADAWPYQLVHTLVVGGATAGQCAR